MKAKTVKETLVAARWILENVGWCQGYYFKDAEGRDASTLHPEDIHCACTLGALSLVEKEDPGLYMGALRILEPLVGKGTMIARWNDQEGRTKEEVLDLFDRAIKGVE